MLTAVGLWPHFATRRHGPRRLAGPAASHPLFGIIARAYGIIALPIIPIPVVPIRPPSAAGIAASSGDGGGRRRQEGQLGFGAATAVVLVGLGALVGRRYRSSKRPT